MKKILSNNYFVLIFLPVFILGISAIAHLIATQSYSYLIATAVFWVLLSGLGISSGFHKIFSHGCYDLKPWLNNFVLYCGTMACQGSSITWSALHKYHHKHTDTADDPHTPTKGIFFAFVGWTFNVTQETLNYKYAIKLIRNPVHAFFHKNYYSIVWLSILTMIIVLGWKIVFYGYFIAAFISILQDNSVNVFCHIKKMGYRNYETKDDSTNVALLGYLGWGLGWHNNHHKFPGRFNFGMKWWEIDPTVIFIPLFKFGSIKK